MGNLKWLLAVALMFGAGRACMYAQDHAGEALEDTRQALAGDPCSPSHGAQRYALEHEAGMDLRCDETP